MNWRFPLDKSPNVHTSFNIKLLMIANSAAANLLNVKFQWSSPGDASTYKTAISTTTSPVFRYNFTSYLFADEKDHDDKNRREGHRNKYRAAPTPSPLQDVSNQARMQRWLVIPNLAVKLLTMQTQCGFG
jgi:hypothetical protein